MVTCGLKRPTASDNGPRSPTLPLPADLAARPKPPICPQPYKLQLLHRSSVFTWRAEVRGECPLHKFRGECLLLLRLIVLVWPGLLSVGDKHQVDNSLRRIKPYYSSECLGAPCSHSPLKLAPIPFPTRNHAASLKFQYHHLNPFCVPRPPGVPEPLKSTNIPEVGNSFMQHHNLAVVRIA